MTPPEFRRVRYLKDPEDKAEGWACGKYYSPGCEKFQICDYENEGSMYDENNQRKYCKQCGQVWSNNITTNLGRITTNYWYYRTERIGVPIPSVPEQIGHP